METRLNRWLIRNVRGGALDEVGGGRWWPFVAHRGAWTALLVGLSAVAFGGCGSDSQALADASQEIRLDDIATSDSSVDDAAEVAGDGVDATWEVGEWQVVEPGGTTGCSDGSPFRFFVRPGDPERALVLMQGGGACWNAMTCAMGPAMARPDIPSFEEFLSALEKKQLAGLLDLQHPEHPFPDYTVVYIPYCSSDLHWGRGVHEYNSKLEVPHLGYFNASSALQWLYDNVPAPKKLLLMGSSAGGYGMLLHSAWVAKHYPDADIRVVIDAAAGIVAGDFTATSMEVWQAEDSMPTFIPELNSMDLSTLLFPDLFSAIAAYYPQHRFAMYSAAWDDQQAFFYKVMGGKAEDWPGKLQETLTAMRAGIPNLSFFVPSGSLHTILPFEAYYVREQEGRKFAAWLEEFATSDEVPEDVNCPTAQCSFDPICDVCPKEEDPSAPFHCYVCFSMSGL